MIYIKKYENFDFNEDDFDFEEENLNSEYIKNNKFDITITCENSYQQIEVSKELIKLGYKVHNFELIRINHWGFKDELFVRNMHYNLRFYNHAWHISNINKLFTNITISFNEFMSKMTLKESFEFNEDDFDFEEEEYNNYDKKWENIRNIFVWTTSNKKTIKLKNMDADHIVNVIKWIKKYRDSYGKKHSEFLINQFNTELEYRGIKSIKESFEFNENDFDFEEEDEFLTDFLNDKWIKVYKKNWNRFVDTLKNNNIIKWCDNSQITYEGYDSILREESDNYSDGMDIDDVNLDEYINTNYTYIKKYLENDTITYEFDRVDPIYSNKEFTLFENNNNK